MRLGTDKIESKVIENEMESLRGHFRGREPCVCVCMRVPGSFGPTKLKVSHDYMVIATIQIHRFER